MYFSLLSLTVKTTFYQIYITFISEIQILMGYVQKNSLYTCYENCIFLILLLGDTDKKTVILLVNLVVTGKSNLLKKIHYNGQL